MRGTDCPLAHMLCDVSERWVPADHPLRPIRVMVDAAFKQLSPRFEARYSPYRAAVGAAGEAVPALLLRVFYRVRREALLMEQLDYNLLFRSFVGLNMDEAVWGRPRSRRTTTGC